MTKSVRLGDLATYINGYAFKPSDRGDSGLPIIRIQDLTGNAYDTGYYDGDYPSKIEINNGDILISWSASLGVYEWNGGKALLNQHIFKVVFDKLPVDKNYFIYGVRYQLAEMGKKTHGATMKHIVKKDFENTRINFPSYEEQVDIAKRLYLVSNIMKNRQKQLDKLDLLVKARFVEMFGTYPNNEKNWKTGKNRDLVTDVRYGSSRKAAEGSRGKYPYLRMNNITYSGELNLKDVKTINANFPGFYNSSHTADRFSASRISFYA